MAHTDGTVAVVAWSAHPSNLPLVEAWQARGIRAELLAPPEARRRLDAGDTALVRIDVAATFDGVEPGLRDVAALAPRGVRLLNRPAALLAAHDKLRTAQLLASAGIPHPRTVHCQGAGEIRALAPPFVLKPRFGSWGQDLTLCTTTDDVDACLSTLRARVWFARHGALIQEVVQVSGRDLRILVAGGRVVGALERVAPRGEWRTNEALGRARGAGATARGRMRARRRDSTRARSRLRRRRSPAAARRWPRRARGQRRSRLQPNRLTPRPRRLRRRRGRTGAHRACSIPGSVPLAIGAGPHSRPPS